MSMLEKYRTYFDIDPDYFPAVNASVIEENPDVWKKFYPHTTFLKLLKDTISALTRKQKLSIWVEGSYGTGKSHAVLTLKKLLDATEDETKEYFEKFNIDNDLYNSFQGVKNSGEILTVHRYGSSAIRGDHNLIFVIQESIENTLKTKGIQNTGSIALKEAVLTWLLDKDNKNYFNSLIVDSYANLFGGDTADDVIEKLNVLSGDFLLVLMNKIFTVSDERNIKMLSLDAKGLAEWIKEVIRVNNLKAIVFIWDEFTEYFNNNKRSLTGFQEIIEISETDPFYLMIVTHKSAGLFDDGDKDKSKILGRFMKPTCQIELPENMAFQLMGAAMEKNKNEEIAKDWDMIQDDLYDRTNDARKLVKQSAKITDTELKAILPIHPYTALLLKYISSAFDSNQRSMFDFIKNDRGEELKGFQWYIDNYGPDDENPLLTVDMLWEFFYEKGKESLSQDIRAILDSYTRVSVKSLAEEEKRVLKTTLLLQAISQKAGNAVELFIPNEKNINNAFEGTDIDGGGASRCAEKLIRDEVLYKKPLGAGEMQYTALINSGDTNAVEKLKVDVQKKSTSFLMNEGQLDEAVSLGGALKLRYELKYVSSTDFESTVKLLRNQEGTFSNKILAVVSYAKDDSESATIEKKIKAAIEDGSYNMVFIDASLTPLGKDGYEQYCDNMAQSMYYQSKDKELARQYEANAKESLKKWKTKILEGEFIVYTEQIKTGKRVNTIEEMYHILEEINKEKYPNCLEAEYTVIANMYVANSLKVGVACGARQEVTGTFKSSNIATKLEEALKPVWNYEGKYWEEKPHLLISKIKQHVDSMITNAFLENGGRVSITSVYDELKSEPFGFMPCNLTAFIMGFVLKEYIDDKYSWSDGIVSDALTLSKLQEMIDEVIKLQITPNTRHKEKYIVAMTEDEKAFIDITSAAFGISKEYCSSIEQTRERIRAKMKELSFPIWTLKYIVSDKNIKTEVGVVQNVIEQYCGIANNNNVAGVKTTDNDIAYAIGKNAIDNPNLADDLKELLTKENCTEGMKVYLRQFESGELIQLSEDVGDNGQYINVLRKKFDADAANWVWNIDTAESKIREVILEYKIVFESNQIISKTTSFENAIKEWCDKCKYIRIAYVVAKNYLGEAEPILQILHSIKKSGTLLGSQKQKFYELLQVQGNLFKDFYETQIQIFQKSCEFYLADFSEEDIEKVFKTIPSDSFTREKAEYNNLIKEKVAEYKQTNRMVKLRELWKEKTNTDSPREWSEKEKMPILCMIEDNDLQEAREVFATINKNQSSANAIEKAISFIERATFFENLQDEKEREKAFVRSILKNYALMLTDLSEVKDYLKNRTTAEPYDWFALPEVDRKLSQLAESKYNEGGCNQALEKIENMEVSELKRYLKDLVQDNMLVGLAIIKED